MPQQNQVILNPVKMKLLLEFEAAFPDEKPKTIEEYLKGGSRSVILKVAASFLGFKNQKSKFEDSLEALKMFFRTENLGFAKQVHQRILKLEKDRKQILIFTTNSSLSLFECFFKTNEEEETQTEVEFEINLFKAYLVLNSAYTKKRKIAVSSVKGLDKELQYAMMMFCMFYATSDKINYNIYEQWTTQTIKAIYLFEFLEKHEKSKPLLAAFLASFKCKTWEEYLKRLLPLTFSAISNENESHTDITVTEGAFFEEGCAFLEKLIVKEEEQFQENDFLSIRAKPFYKIKTGVYRIIFNLFVVEKIFKGIYFLMREVNDKLPKEHKIPELKSFVGHEFSEKILFYQIMKLIYTDKCIAFTGKELDDMKISGAPDYYIRKGKDILLLESKDFLIPAAIKDSCDYAQYDNELAKKLYFVLEKGVKKPKAVLQLVNSIRKLLKNEFAPDIAYNYREVSIYPILITHDHQYDAIGFNHLLNHWFQQELATLEEEGFFIRRIKPLVVVNIDSLIYHQVGLQKTIPLHIVLNKYCNFIRMIPGIQFPTQEQLENYVLTKLTSFAYFIDNFFTQLEVKEIPPMLHDLGLTLFKNDQTITSK